MKLAIYLHLEKFADNIWTPGHFHKPLILAKFSQVWSVTKLT